MNADKIKEDFYLLLKKHSINIDEALVILDEIFYEKYSRIYKSYNTNCGENGTTSFTCGASTPVHDCHYSYYTTSQEDPDITNNNPNCDY